MHNTFWISACSLAVCASFVWPDWLDVLSPQAESRMRAAVSAMERIEGLETRCDVISFQFSSHLHSEKIVSFRVGW